MVSVNNSMKFSSLISSEYANLYSRADGSLWTATIMNSYSGQWIFLHTMVTQLFIHGWYSWQVTITKFHVTRHRRHRSTWPTIFNTAKTVSSTRNTSIVQSQNFAKWSFSPKVVIQQSQPRISTFVTAGLQQSKVFPHYTHKEHKDARANSRPISRRSTCTLNYILWSQVSPSSSTYWESQRSLWSNARDPCHHLLEHSLPGPHTYTGRETFNTVVANWLWEQTKGGSLDNVLWGQCFHLPPGRRRRESL